MEVDRLHLFDAKTEQRFGTWDVGRRPTDEMKDFDGVRRAAVMHDLLAFLLRRPADLLPFEEVRERLRLRGVVVDRAIQEVPLARIAGTVQRERDFNRAFLRRDEKLRGPVAGPSRPRRRRPGVPAGRARTRRRRRGLRRGRASSGLRRARPGPRLDQGAGQGIPDGSAPLGGRLPRGRHPEGGAGGIPGGHAPVPADARRVPHDGAERLRAILDHISVHRYYRGIELDRPVPWEEAVASWRDAVYRPMVERVRASHALDEFPGRTETDLYLFTMDHLHTLRERYGPDVALSRAVRHFELSLSRGRGPIARLRAWWRNRRRPLRARPGSGL